MAIGPMLSTRNEARNVEHSPRVVATVVLLVSVSAGAMALLGPGSLVPEIHPELVFLALILASLIVFSDYFEIDAPLASVRVTVSVSAALCFAAAITLGPLLGAAVAFAGVLAVEIMQRRELIKTVVNTTTAMFATFTGGYVYYWLADANLSPIGSIENLLATIVAASAYTLVDSGMIALVLAQVVGHSPLELWRANLRWALFEHISLPTMGIMIPVLYRESVFAMVIVVIPLLGPYLAFRNYKQVHEETRATLGVLADMLDRRDPYTAEHSQRVSDLVDRMLHSYSDVSFDDYEKIITAARIHDLGKVTTTDATLLKPGKLEPHEFEEMKRHSADGAEIMAHISIFRDVSHIIRHHHERWDGKGYPSGIAGEEIPVGSRLIAVADTYDAMTTDRPYRSALPHQVAVDEIRRNSGMQFEPRAVDAFLQVINELSEPAAQPVMHEVNASD
ncbi:MAG: HD-GYP domain-containing protein [Thermomicrobiaceae bacterium]